MVVLVNERISESCESKTLIEQLQYLLDLNHKPTKEDKCVETELNVADKCINCTINTENKSTLTNEETNNRTVEVFENPSFTEIISNNISKTNKINTTNNEIVNDGKESFEKNLITYSTPSSNSTSKKQSCSKIVDEESSIFQINEQSCSTPTKIIEEIKNNIEETLQFSSKNIHYENELNS